MPTTRPGFIWSGTEWVAIGQEAVVNPFYYQATAPTGAATGAIWIESDVDVPSIDSSQFLRWRKTMAGGETSLSGNDDSSLSLAYTPGYEQLYINGVLQVRGGDYTATTGTTVTGLTALVANDVVEIFSAVARTVADVYTQTQSDARFVNKNVGGLNLVVPTSVTGGTVSANGEISIGSAVSSITINGVFSATYDNYRVVINGVDGPSVVNFNLTFPGASSGYYGSHYYDNFAGGTTGTDRSNNSSFLRVGVMGSQDDSNTSFDVYNPFIAKRTAISGTFYGDSYTGWFGGTLANTVSYNGFIISPGSSTMSGGKIRVYGYNNGA
jgi:hypothetical protein